MVGIVQHLGLTFLHRLREKEQQISSVAPRLEAARVDAQFAAHAVKVFPTRPGYADSVGPNPLRRKEITAQVGIIGKSA